MRNHTYGEIFERDSQRVSRPSRSAARMRQSYNEDLISPNIGNERDDGVPNSSSFPCTDFLRAAGILENFLFLVNRVGLTTYMEDERHQHVMVTKTFVESFSFYNSHFRPTVSFKIYDRPFTMTLKDLCAAIGTV